MPSLADELLRFLVVRLNLDSLSTKTTLRKLKNALSALPDGLNESYDEVIMRIRGQSRDDHLLARQVLFLITFAMAPLSLPMIQHALAVEPFEDTSLEEEDIPVKMDLLSCCAGMIVLQHESMNVKLVHYTAQEYLKQRKMNLFPEAYEEILKICLTYLSFDEFVDGPCDTGCGITRPSEKISSSHLRRAILG